VVPRAGLEPATNCLMVDMEDLRFFSQEMEKAFVPDRYIDVFQGRAPKNVLARHYNPQGI